MVAAWMGEGGTIPFMAMLGSRFPDAQFLITGVLGPGSNAHGPNEFLHLPTGRRVTAAVALVLDAHAARTCLDSVTCSGSSRPRFFAAVRSPWVTPRAPNPAFTRNSPCRSSIVRRARADINRLTREGKTVKVLTVGKKGRDMLRRDHGKLFVGHIDLTEVKRVGYEDARRIAQDILGRFDQGEFDVATIYFSRFKSVIAQEPTEQQIIPAKFDEAAEVSTLYDYEPSEEGILADLLPRGIATQVFAALLENAASEQGARMSAMDNATRNAGDMIEKLSISYNRQRQAQITTELVEIISGAEAL